MQGLKTLQEAEAVDALDDTTIRNPAATEVPAGVS
jgi:hypothetical protein